MKRKHSYAVIAVVVGFFAVAVTEHLYVLPKSVAVLLQVTKQESALDESIAQARKGGVRLPVYDAGAAFSPHCQQIAFCFDAVVLDRAETIIASTPLGFSYATAEVRRICAGSDCQYVDRYDVFLSPASPEAIADVQELRNATKLDCVEFDAGYRRGRYCRQDIYYGDELVEMAVAAYLYKPLSYGFLLFDQEFILVADWRVNFLTGTVNARHLMERRRDR
jgi:hypothetical protein